MAALEKLEQVHREQRKDLLEANEDLQNPGVTKVGKMQRKIHSVKENLETKEKTVLNLLDQPNSDGNTVMHITTRMDDDEATQLLLVHGANPNVQDVDGNSPLHTICNQGDIQTATWIIKNNGRVLENKQKETPQLHNLFFGQDEVRKSQEEVRKLMEAVCQSNHRKEILEEILRKRHLLVRLVEEDKPEILSFILKNLSKDEQEEYVNLVQSEKDRTTCLHIATLTRKSLKCASILLEAGARFRTNASGLLPNIEQFFSPENDDQITSALVDGLVERVETNQLSQEKALELLFPDDWARQIYFQRASEKNWTLIAQWDVAHLMDANFVKWLIQQANESKWSKEEVGSIVCKKNADNQLILTTLDEETQKEVAVFNKAKTCSALPYMEKKANFLQWLYQEAFEGRWDEQMVFKALTKEEVDGQVKITPRIKSGFHYRSHRYHI